MQRRMIFSISNWMQSKKYFINVILWSRKVICLEATVISSKGNMSEAWYLKRSKITSTKCGKWICQQEPKHPKKGKVDGDEFKIPLGENTAVYAKTLCILRKWRSVKKSLLPCLITVGEIWRKIYCEAKASKEFYEYHWRQRKCSYLPEKFELWEEKRPHLIGASNI